MVANRLQAYIQAMISIATHDDCFAKPKPQNPALGEYDAIRRAVDFISTHWRIQPSAEKIADVTGVSVDELHILFRRWAGQPPATFLKAVTLLQFLDDCREPVVFRADKSGFKS